MIYKSKQSPWRLTKAKEDDISSSTEFVTQCVPFYFSSAVSSEPPAMCILLGLCLCISVSLYVTEVRIGLVLCY